MADIPSSGFVFDEDAISRALLNIYHKAVDPVIDIEPNLFRETWRIFNQAADKGFMQSGYNPSDEFRNQVRYNNAVFSAFKVHRQQNDMAARMLDDDGNLKPFPAFARDVADITSHYNKQWLHTEYDTAVTRAHRAAEWKQFEMESDVLPNVEWMKTLSPDPGEDHRPFWGIVLPIIHKFWGEHKPGDRWNCKCGLQATDAKPTGRPVGNPVQPATGLDSDPAKTGQVFSQSHPYMPANCASCRLPGDKILSDLAGISGPKRCYGCSRTALAVAKQATVKMTAMAKDLVYSLPYRQQFRSVFEDEGKHVLQHLFAKPNKNDPNDDHADKLEIAKVFVRTFRSNVYINPTVPVASKTGRKRIFKGIKSGANPDLTTVFGYVDIKSPMRYNNSVKNINKASGQDAIALLSTHKMAKSPTLKQLDDIVSNVWKSDIYDKDMLFIYHDGNLLKYKRP